MGVRIPPSALFLKGIRGERSKLLRLIKEQYQRVAESRRSEAETAESPLQHYETVGQASRLSNEVK